MKTYYCSQCGGQFESEECEQTDGAFSLGLGLKCPACGGLGKANGVVLIIIGLTLVLFSIVFLKSDAFIFGMIFSAVVIGLGIFRWIDQCRRWNRVGKDKARAAKEAEAAKEARAADAVKRSIHRNQPDAKTAAEVLFCLEQLQNLETTQPEYAWLWQIRSKVLRYFVEQYRLRRYAEGHLLSDDEKRRIIEAENLLHPPESTTPEFESDEVAKVRERLHRKLQHMEAFGEEG